MTGTKSGTADISVSVNGTQFTKHKTLQLNADSSTWKIKDASVSNTTIIAGDTNGVTYQASVVDANDNILPNVIVSWKLRGLADDYDFSTYTDAQGIAKTKVTSHVAGILQMSAYLDLNNHKPIDDVTVQPAAIDADKSTLSSNRQSIGGDNQDKATLTVKLVDKYDNVILGKKVTLSATKKVTYSQDPLANIGKGEYQTDVTSNIQGDVTFTAKAESTSLTNTLTINVTAPKPIIVFDKKLQQEVYSSTPVQALGYTGLPSNLKAMWSSSEPTVATIDAFTGEITLLKAGQSLITLQTTGDDHFLPAENNYPLQVEKADPGLSAKNPQINSTWDDGITQQISATFSNPDSAKNPPSLQFSSTNNTILTVDNQGSITAVKPGDATINVTSDATEQFKAATAIVNYHQDKGVLHYTFKNNPEILSDSDIDNGPIPAQKATPTVPDQAQATWSSSNPQSVTVTPEGMITYLRYGNADLTLEVKNNAYYQDYSNRYEVSVNKTPKIKIDQIEFTSMDSKKSETDLSKINWHPLYVTDNSFTVKWSPIDELPFAIDFVLKDSSGNEIATLQRHNYGGGSSGNNISDPVIFENIDSNYLNKSNKLTLEVKVFDPSNKFYSKYYTINISGIDASDANSLLNINKNSIFFHTKDGSTTNNCQYPSESEPTHLFIQVAISLHKQNKALLYPIDFNVKIKDIKLENSGTIEGTIIDNVTYPSTKTFYKNLDETLNFYETSSNYAIDRECRNTDAGKGRAVITITVNNNSSYIEKDFKWSGMGNITQ